MSDERKIKKPIKPMIQEQKSGGVQKTKTSPKKRNVKGRMRVSWQILLMGGVFLYASITFISLQTKASNLKQAKVELLETQSDLENKINIKGEEADYVGSEAYIEWSAREKFGWVKGDEIIFREKDEE